MTRNWVRVAAILVKEWPGKELLKEMPLALYDNDQPCVLAICCCFATNYPKI
jgi:hypothetical protein